MIFDLMDYLKRYADENNVEIKYEVGSHLTWEVDSIGAIHMIFDDAHIRRVIRNDDLDYLEDILDSMKSELYSFLSHVTTGNKEADMRGEEQ